MGLPSGIFSRSYQQDAAIVRTKTQWTVLIISLIATFTIPLWLPSIPILGSEIASQGIINVICIYIIAVMGLQIMMGYCGQLSAGHAAFMAVGAYTSGLLTAKLGLTFWLALPCAALAAGIIGVIFGAASIRLKGFYLVAATLAAQFVITWAILKWASITGGDAGLQVPYPTIGSFSFDSDAKNFYIIAAVLLLGTFFARNLIRTRIGRAFIAVRDNELAASVMGIRLITTKLLAFFIGCAYAGVAGAIWVHWLGMASPDLFNIWFSWQMLGYMVIGGFGTILGTFLGVIFMELLNNSLGSLVVALGAPAYALYLRSMVFGLAIIFFLLFEPKGLAHRWTLFKMYFRFWPYIY